MMARERRPTGGCHFYRGSFRQSGRGAAGRSAGGDTGITALFKFIISKKNKGRLPESGIASMPPESHVDADPDSEFRAPNVYKPRYGL